MEAQEIFDTVARHLFKQGRASVDASGECRYRGLDGCSCAVGCLITDDEYRPRMEGEGVSTLLKLSLLPERLVSPISLLRALQMVHDDAARTAPGSTFCEYIRQDLASVASERGLSSAVLNEVMS